MNVSLLIRLNRLVLIFWKKSEMISEVASWTPIICAPLLIMAGIVLIFRASRANFSSGSLVMFGLALVVFNAMNPKEVSVSPSGFTMKTGVSEAKATETANTANLQPFIEKTNKSLEVINSALAQQDKKINAVVSASKSENPDLPELSHLTTPSIPKIPIPSGQPGKTVLVFYRNNEQLANSIVATLRSRGYKSAASNSSLTEIKQWVSSTGDNDITIAANGINDELLDSLKNIITRGDNVSANKIDMANGWAFKASDAQIYIF